MCNSHILLARKRALLACSEMKSGSLVAGLESLGADVLVFPVILIKAIDDKRALDAALDAMHQYAWIIFTSVYGVRFFLNRMEERGIAKERVADRQICAVGPGTAAALETKGIRVSLIPREYMAGGIVAALEERHGGMDRLAGVRILLPRARDARDTLPNALDAAGVRVDLVACYENLLPEIEPDRVRSVVTNPPDLLVFTSSSTVRNFVTLLGRDTAGSVLAAATVAALGPITAHTLASYGKPAEIVPQKSTIPSLLDAIRIHYQTSDQR
jgi:uroporphyrinogen-III synthase